VKSQPTTREERQAVRRRRNRRAVAVSAASTLAVLGGIVLAIVLSPGWHTVRLTFFSWHWFRVSLHPLIDAFWLDVRMFLIVEVVVLVLGMTIALIRTLRSPILFPLRAASAVFVDVMRGVPLLLLLYLIGFGVPALQSSFLPNDETILGGAALAFCYSAYVSEVFRAGIQSVHPSQPAAGLALGLTRSQVLTYVVVPQAVRRVVPPLLNDFISLTKDVALISVLGPQEILRVAQIIQDYNFNFTPLVAAGVVYLCVTIPLIRIVDRSQARARRQQEGVLVVL
jgi:polar amino acid transport system permease protein